MGFGRHHVLVASYLMSQLMLFTSYSIAADVDSSEASQTKGQPASSVADIIKVEGIEVKASRIRIISPLPGVGVDRDQASTNIQSATGKQISDSKATTITEFMNSQMQSVTTTDYAGNPFQQDLNFRGFTASPSIGTPQGLSVYLDGVRINEAFGDVVNWDLIPMNALASLDLIPGSNPLFGLNTLGGALALRTKNGFTDNHARGEITTGAWGREQQQFSNGVNNGVFGLFTAYNHFKEDGWRNNSPSDLRQLYNNATLRLPHGEINFSMLNVDTHLVGNGLLPFETAALDREAVYTSPDESKNSLDHYNLNARWDVTDNLSISALAYRRNMNQYAVSGDVYEGYKKLVSAWGNDIDGDGIDDATKVNGVFNLSDLNQTSKGWALQGSWELGHHQLTGGLAYDANHVDFFQSQLLGMINGDHEVEGITDPVFVDNGYDIVKTPVIRNNLTGGSTTKGIFISDTWSPIDTLHITYGGRFNWSNVKNTLISDKGKELYNFASNDFLPARQRCYSLPGDPFPTFPRFVCSSGDYDYRSFNPSVGISWEPIKQISLYGNLSRGSRVPTALELGCARDHTLDGQPAGSTNFQFGCSIPTSLTSDPYLKQVRSTAYELGIRGSAKGIDWNVGLFRTELTNDILFVPLGQKNRGVFDNFGETLRRGIEMGMSGEIGRSKFRLNYTYMLATFESKANVINPANSSSTKVVAQDLVNISPGDELPGMPRHVVQASWGYRFTDKFDATLNMVMHSYSYVRGNENNDHESRAKTGDDLYDYLGSGTVPGYAVFNLRASYKVTPAVTAFLKVDNLFDRDYSTAGSLGVNPFTPSGSFKSYPNEDTWKYTTFIGPGAPRAAWIGLSVDLDWKKINFKKEN